MSRRPSDSTGARYRYLSDSARPFCSVTELPLGGRISREKTVQKRLPRVTPARTALRSVGARESMFNVEVVSWNRLIAGFRGLPVEQCSCFHW